MQKTYNYTAQAIGPRGFSVYLAFADTENGDGFSREQLNKRFISFVIATEEPPQSSFTKWTQHIGDSAYELALKSGFIGTEAEWLTSLNGASHWSQIDGIPTSFQPKGHDHNTLYNTKSEVDQKIADSKAASDLAITTSESTLNTRITTEVATLNASLDGKIGGLKTELEESISNTSTTINNRITAEVSTLNSEVSTLKGIVDGKANTGHTHLEYETIANVETKVNSARSYTDNSVLALKNSVDSQVSTAQATLNARITSEVAALNTSISGKANQVHQHDQYDTIVSVDGKINGLKTYVNTEVANARAYTDTKSQSLKTDMDSLSLTITSQLDRKQKKIVSSVTQPLTPANDDIWIDTSVAPYQIKTWNGTTWVSVGYSGVVVPLILNGLGVTSATHPLVVKNASGVEILKASDDGVVTANVRIKDWNGLQLSEVSLGSSLNNEFAVRHKNGATLMAASLTQFSSFSLTANTTKVVASKDLDVNGKLVANAVTVKSLGINGITTAEQNVLPKDPNILVFNSERNRHEFFDSVSNTWRVVGIAQSETDARYVRKSGDTITGVLNIVGTGTTDGTKPLSIKNSAGVEKVYVTDGGAIYADRFNGFRIDQASTVNTIARRDWKGYLEAEGITLHLGIISGPEGGTEFRAQDVYTGTWSWRDIKVKNIASESVIEFRTLDKTEYQGIESLTSRLRGHTTAQRDAIVAPKPGLQIYNTTTKQHEFFNGVAWIHYGITQSENDGRYLRLTGGNVTGKLGVGIPSPVSKVHVKGGDIEVDDFSTGVILRSPDGTRWRLVIDNTGAINSQKA
jgi:hypothetical protein